MMTVWIVFNSERVSKVFDNPSAAVAWRDTLVKHGALTRLVEAQVHSQ